MTTERAATLRIFSYQPNPRLYKATIAARISGTQIEIVGAAPPELPKWLWDYDARELSEQDRAANPQWARTARRGFQGSIYKTDAFLDAHPFGNVPAGFIGEDRTGVFESNSIMRAAARGGDGCPELYGPDWQTASRIDGFLDRTLLFAEATQRHLLAGRRGMNAEIHADTSEALEAYLTGIETALARSRFIAADHLTLADIAFACEIALLSGESGMREAMSAFGAEPVLGRMSEFPRSAAHIESFAAHPHFTPDLGPYFERLSRHDWWRGAGEATAPAD